MEGVPVHSKLLTGGGVTLFLLLQVHEACLLALEVVISQAEGREGSEKLDFQAFVQNVVFPDLASGGDYFARWCYDDAMAPLNISSVASPLLTGRCLWLTSKMTAHLKPEILQQYVVFFIGAKCAPSIKIDCS